MIDLSKEALDALVRGADSWKLWLDNLPVDEDFSIGLGRAQEYITGLANTITALRQQIAAMEAKHAQQIAAAEAAATERAAEAWFTGTVGRVQLTPESKRTIRAQITPEAAIALATREAAADRAGYLRGLREAATSVEEICQHSDIPGGCCIPDKFDEGTSAAYEAILALAERAEKGGA